MGVFRTIKPVPVLAGLQAVCPHRLVVLLVRYSSGTLTYDELILGSFARRGLRLGLSIDRIWVDSAVSVWGGRENWGVPKYLAEFEWSGDRVAVSDSDGPVATIDMNLRTSRMPRVRLPMPSFGDRDGDLVLFTSRSVARPVIARPRIVAWEDRFGYQPVSTGVGVGLNPFDAVFPAARTLHHAADPGTNQVR